MFSHFSVYKIQISSTNIQKKIVHCERTYLKMSGVSSNKEYYNCVLFKRTLTSNRISRLTSFPTNSSDKCDIK